MNIQEHYSVLLEESVSALVWQPSGVYLDGTFGRGGHSQKILASLKENGRLIATDKDPRAIEVGRELEKEDERFKIVHASFAELKKARSEAGEGFDGILLDLGVSSPQLDEAERGFSFMRDGPLDMRMDSSCGESAADWVNNHSEQDMIKAFRDYGEERFAKRIARAIVERRSSQLFSRTLDLAEVVKAANPKWEKDKHPATRVFQAIRISVNNELGDLELFLDQALESLKPSGRLVIISFHSLEDRIVKRFLKKAARGQEFPKGLPVTADMMQPDLKIIGKALKASADEVKTNVRSRSAVMRVAQKLIAS